MKELIQTTETTFHNLEESVMSIRNQDENVEKMNQNFVATGEKLRSLIVQLKEVHDNINIICSSNGEIVKEINQLSASTEEVTAVSQEGLVVSDSIQEKMVYFHELLSNINYLMTSLQQLVHKE